MVIIRNDCVLITKDDPSFLAIRSDLTFFNSGTHKIYKKNKFGQTYVREQNYHNTEYLYQNYENGISVMRGLLYYLNPYFKDSEIKDEQNKSEFYDLKLDLDELQKYSSILSGITLTNEQMIAIRKMIMCKRMIARCSTGFGKTELMCGFLKIANDKLGRYPTTLIIEPTIVILNGTISRLSKYDIPVSNYRETRSIVDGCANVCHPKSLINDLKKNPHLLDSVNVIFGDEVHHMKSIIFRLPYGNINNVDYSIGLSASAVQSEHLGKPLLTDYYSSELNMIGSAGPVTISMSSGSLIEKGFLAIPAVIVMNNEADEWIPEIEKSNWHKIVSDKLYSENRTRTTCEVVQFFNSKNRKILILVNTVEWSQKILKYLNFLDPLLKVRASYGGGRFEYFDGENFIKDDTDVFKRFSDGEFNILIGTSHIYEGADVPNLDVLILAFGGKGERMVTQGIGRVLRKTKNGKYAYVIDFNDSQDGILNYQYKTRKRLIYKGAMKVPDNMFFENVESDELEGIFNKLEEI